MSVRQVLKRSAAIVGARQDLNRLLASLRGVERFGPNSIARRYLRAPGTKKLHIGAGPSAIPGWLSADLFPVSGDTMYLDATRRFPFTDAAFDYIYTEHMIEHVPWQDALKMLKECRRVLKPSGTLRVATPDLAVMIGLHARRDPLAARYVEYITDHAAGSYLAGIPDRKHAFVINCAFHDWGHQFLYDTETLELILREAGFTHVTRYEPGQSDDPQLSGIEFHGRTVERHGVNLREMADFETMVLEAS